MTESRLPPSSLLGRIAPVPTARDPAEQIAVHLVTRTVDVILAAGALFQLVAMLHVVQVNATTLVSLPALLVALFIIRLRIGRDRVRAAATALCVLGWLGVSVDLVVHGPYTVALGGLAIVVTVGAFTLGPLAAGLLAAASIVELALVMTHVVEVPGAQAAPPGDLERLLHFSIQLSLLALLTGWWARRSRALVGDLRSSRQRLQLLLETSPDAIVSCDAEGRVTYQNRAALALLGYPNAEVVGRKWFEVPAFRSADLAEMIRRFKEVVGGNGAYPPPELILARRDGRAVVVESNGVAIVDEGRVVGTLTVLRDLTAHKAAEAERESLQRQLLGAQRTEAMGLIAGGVAHDFNNLLTVILSATEALEADGHTDEAIGDIRDAARRGAALTRQLLTFSRTGASAPRPVDVNRAVRDLRPLLERLFGAGRELRLELTPGEAVVRVDPSQLDQVLINLAANARDAMPDGGTFTVRTRVDGEHLELLAIDTGKGMDARTVAAAFEPFFTTKGERGTGLGLAVVHSVVRGAGGSVAIESAVGQGATFRVRLPLSSEPLAATPVDAKPQPTPARRMLVIDDDAAVRTAIVRSLERLGLRTTGREPPRSLDELGALEQALVGCEALVSDISMPGMSGVEVALELRRRGHRLPILFVSGYASHGLIDQARHIPDTAFLAKPFTPDAIRACLDRLLGAR